MSFLRQLVAFARTIRLSHSLFALPFALGTALFVDFRTPRRIVEGLKELLAELGETDINDIVGTVELP